MASEDHGAVVRGIERIFNEGSLTGLSGGQLLRQFASGDEAAFEALVRRHGPLVLSVCRRLLHDPRDVDDAFQATFLVLLKKAGALRDAEALSPWLHGVAYRVAARIRSNSARRPAEESNGARPEAVELACDLERSELRTLIDEEIGRLPEKYRRPVVLCYLEGRTHEEAARRLRCTAGSLRGRLDRAREKLRDRLTRRGLAPTVGLGALAAGGEAASAAVPAPLVAATVATLARAATATAVSVTASVSALALADGVFRAMIVAKLKLAASFVVAAAIALAVGVAWLATLSGSFAGNGRDRPAPVESPSGDASEPAAGERNGPSIEIRFVDHRTGKPVPGVALAVSADRKPGQRTTSDVAGRAAVAIPSPMPRRLSVVVRKDGFAPVTLWFPIPLREAEVPASYTQTIYPSETIGGVVRDEQGRPVAGVRVAPTIWTNSAEIRYLHEVFQETGPATTDAQGRWQRAGMPVGIDRSRVSIAFTHPDYESVNWPVGHALDDVHRGKATVLPRGLDLAGRVVDPMGRPIAGAVVRESDGTGRDIPRVETDADGRFRFTHRPAGATVLTVQAPGFAPDLREIVVRLDSPPLEFRLQKGRTVQGRVVDARGQPLAGATLGVDGWRGHRTLDWRMTTDDEGGFQWTDAPRDAFWIGIWREGYLQISHREVPPAAGEVTVAMVRQLKVRGTVVDAESRHAIQSFTVVPGMERGNGFAPYWDRGEARLARSGRYEIQFDDMMRREGRRLRVEADGYMPAVSRVIGDDEDDPVINFVLHAGAGVSGVVHLPDRTPLAGADVVLVEPSHPAFLTNGLPPRGNDHRVVKTGGDGRFTFPPQELPYTIVALHDRGFAEQRIRNGPAPSSVDLTVRPWGRIEGTLRIGRGPGAGQALNLAYTPQGDTTGAIPWWSGQATTDDAGRFAFERVMPGVVTVSRTIVIKERDSSQEVGYSHMVGVPVAPGATVRLTLGGTGRPVVGKVTAPAPGALAGPIDWTYSRNWLTRKETLLEAAMSRSGLKKAPGACTVKLEADGSFRVEDVEAGTYELSIMVSGPPRDPHRPGIGHDLLASVSRRVVVPPMPGGRSDEPLDLGTIPVTAIKKPAAAPNARKP